MVSSNSKIMFITGAAATLSCGCFVSSLAPSPGVQVNQQHGGKLMGVTSRSTSGLDRYNGGFGGLCSSRSLCSQSLRLRRESMRFSRHHHSSRPSLTSLSSTLPTTSTSTEPISSSIVGGNDLMYNSSFIDFDQMQKTDILDSIAQHVEEIGSDIVFPEDEVLATTAPLPVLEDLHISQQPTVSKTEATTAQPKKHSETRQMVNEVAAIALPSLGGMLLDPIMSLIDTACVGQVSTTALAAMAPCTSIFQFAFFAFFFLSAATTNLVASNPPESVLVPNKDGEIDSKAMEEAARRVDFNEKVVSNASALAVILGSMVTFSLFKFADPLLKLAGVPATNAALLNAARPYLLIRAMGIPFVFLATVLQGGSLGRGDAWRPLRIFGAAGVINLVGDVWLTLFKGWGATGAATATVAAQVGAALYYIISSAKLDKSVEASSKPLRDVALVWRGLPSKQIVKTFMNVAVALFSRSIGLMLAYSMLTRTAALSGTTALAAHQVTLQVWWLLSFLPEPMSVAAQTLITRDMKDRSERVPKLIKTLYQISSVLGVAAAAVTCLVLRAPAVAGALVADVSVQKLMATLVPFAVMSQAYCPIATLSDGVCIGLGSFGHLPGIMVGSFISTAAGLALVASRGLGVTGVWACMNVFLSSRIVGHLLMSGKLRTYLKKAFSGNQRKTPEMQPVAVSP